MALKYSVLGGQDRLGLYSEDQLYTGKLGNANISVVKITQAPLKNRVILKDGHCIIAGW